VGSFYLILGLVFSVIIAIFALANTETVTVSYIFGRSHLPLILLILGSAFTGALVMGLFSLYRSIRSAFAFRQLRHEKERLEKEFKTLKEEKIFLEAELNKAVSVPEEPGQKEEDSGQEKHVRQQKDDQVKQTEAEESGPAKEEVEEDPS